MTHVVCHAWMHLEHDEPQKAVFSLFFSIKNVKVFLISEVQTNKKKSFEVQIIHYIHV